jgi:predicted DNA-binding transcriptional regulator YafY
MPAKTRTTALAAKTVMVRDYLTAHPDCTQAELMQATQTRSVPALYRILLGIKNDASICAQGRFRILDQGRPLTVEALEKYLESMGATESRPPLAERLIYLYNHLHSSSIHGGVSLKALINNYQALLEQYSTDLPKPESIRRSLQRDLSKLESFGILIDRPSTGSPNRKYRLKQEYLPKLSPESAAMLYVSTLLYRDTLLNNAISSVKDTMESSFYKGMPERAKLLRERIYVLNDTLSNPEHFGTTLGSLIRAVSESFRVKVDYINNNSKVSSRVLEPLGLVCKRSVWYLIARQTSNSEIRTFRVDQIKGFFTRESEKFIYPQDFSLSAHIGSSWGVFCDDPVQKVCLCFSPNVAQRIKKLCYHPSQKVIGERADGSVVLEFQVCGLIELRSWLMQWGNQVEVLSPPELRKQVRELAQSVAAIYQKK